MIKKWSNHHQNQKIFLRDRKTPHPKSKLHAVRVHPIFSVLPIPLLLADMDHFFSLFFFSVLLFLILCICLNEFKWLNYLLRIQVFFLTNYFWLTLFLSHIVEFQMPPWNITMKVISFLSSSTLQIVNSFRHML